MTTQKKEEHVGQRRDWLPSDAMVKEPRSGTLYSSSVIVASAQSLVSLQLCCMVSLTEPLQELK